MFNSSVVGNAFTFGGLSGSSNLALQNNAGTPVAVALSVGNNNASTTYSGVLGQGGSLTKIGTGTLALSGANTYSGATAISAGTLQYANAAAVGSTSGIAVTNAGTILAVSTELPGGGSGWSAAQLGTFLGGGTTTFAAGTALGIDTTSGDFTYTGDLGGVALAKGVTKLGSNTLTLSGANTYTGATTINAGTLQAGVAGALPSTTAVTLANASGAVLSLNGYSQTIASLSGGGGSGGNVTLGTATLTVGDATTSTFAGVIGDAPGGSLTKQGIGTLILSGVNTYTGLTTVNAGTLRYGVNNAIKAGNDVQVSGGTLDLNGFAGTVGAVTLSGSAIIGGTLTGASFAVQSGSASAILDGGGAALTKTGPGTVTLTGVNTYTGLTTVNAGTLQYGVNNAIKAGNDVQVSGGTLDLNGFAGTVGAVTLSGSAIIGGTLTSASFAVQSGSASAILDGSGATLTKTGPGTVTLSGVNTYTGLTTVNAGTLDLIGAGSGVAWNPVLAPGSGANLNGGILVFDYSAGGALLDPATTIASAVEGDDL